MIGGAVEIFISVLYIFQKERKKKKERLGGEVGKRKRFKLFSSLIEFISYERH